MNSLNSKQLSVLSLMKEEKGKLAVGILLAVICSALSFVPYYVIYQMILALIGGTLTFQTSLFWALIAIGAAVLQNIFISCATICTHTAAYNTMHRLKLRVLEHMSQLSLGFFNDCTPGALKGALFDDVGRLEDFIAHNTIELAQAVVVPIILFIALFFLQPIMALCMLIPAVLGVVLPMMMMRRYPDLTNEYAKTMSAVSSAVNEYVNCMPIIKMYGLTAQKFKKYRTAALAYTDCLKNMAKVSCKPLAITIVILDSGILFTLPVGGILYLNGMLTLEMFLLFILLTMCFYSAFFSLLNIMMGHMELESGLVSIKEILNTKAISGGTKILDKSGSYEITFDNVSFGYEKGKDVLSNVSITLKPGTLTAFVGPSGAGKTTAAQLIGRYWDTSSGEISIGGVPLREITIESLMDLTAFVFQDVFLMEDTLLENIRMGSSATEKQVVDAAKAAQIHEFICSLPQGYQTRIGDQGLKLSGGQQQRISIARAILKDAPIVIFDEATSYSDIENEHKIQLALRSLLKEKTTIMIAHRLHTIRNADNIVVFEDGKVLEQGCHDNLLAAGGTYSDMWHTYIGETAQKEVI
ncbi:ABC transporter ATP-binding protein [Anaerotignum sp. MB30-C6]|uniref:ABC transporter ATP-binding protein n=1 Tax=Anaerotignum sp. MB30-C6 TaxID=3070814 RepID=UPI0027DADA32|nr:ABC transporter ATP-binding protein [Anaerotignum sp. MB30-C6]WMI80090.1 ABC transporter ATP-binding protein [Anaerotignum sp. MB30-C6]